jgi:uncharacterized protein (TIGR03435 family)
MKRHLSAMLISTAICGSVVVLAQTLASISPEFEVASIRPASPPNFAAGEELRGPTIDGSHLDFEFVSLSDVLPYAFRVRPYQVVAPSWTRDTRWNILATLPAGSTQDQVPEMMRRLLAERFKLEFHLEKREQQVYELQVAPGGPKVEISTGGEFKFAGPCGRGASPSTTPCAWGFPQFNNDGPLQRGGGVINGQTWELPNCGQRWEFIPLSMSTFAYALSAFTGRPVVDETGLKGDYKVTLDLNADTMVAMIPNMLRSMGEPAPPGGGGRGRSGPAAGPAAQGQTPAAPPDDMAGCIRDAQERAAGADGNLSMLFQAVQKLGLKLQQDRAPIDTIVVDRLEKTPTEN